MFGLFQSKKDKYLIDNANRFADYIEQNCYKRTIDCLTTNVSGLETLREISEGTSQLDNARILNIISSAIFAFRCTEEISYLKSNSFSDKAVSHFLSCLIRRETESFERARFEQELRDVLTMHNALQVRRLASDESLEYHFSIYIVYVLKILGFEPTEQQLERISGILFRPMISFPTVIKTIGQNGLL